MNAPMQQTIPAEIGTPFEGGFYAGRFNCDGAAYALIVSPKTQGETSMTWGEYGQDIPGARSYFNGLANTQAMAEAGSDLAKWALDLNISGHTDWYIPSRDELEMLYRAFKPTAEENDCSFRDGDNASSIPAGYPYTAEEPSQTAASAFRDGGAEAFADAWHWASTPYSPNTAWTQGFVGGYQGRYHKYYELRARAVRRILISN
ncbi:DUF1566 domain-containing protein [Chromobacterium phragmitis]|uniref:DUF1566 domain-containing protein n=1 Tax=Chromobacterium amazonense TaxID=1382803 RepID=UPI0021B7D374|nr:DUF1566 domain-containing protein [Chromobacterium amazonense]MBM2883960.1 DUF1566 domain-containing protein [Chromobacterium amazonense]MDE1711877.1 DUF1566 domain-containing protein [Chromobacterium amazonense]